MSKVPGVWPDDRGLKRQAHHHNLLRTVRHLEGVRHTVREVRLEEGLVDPAEDTRRMSPISHDVSMNSSECCQI